MNKIKEALNKYMIHILVVCLTMFGTATWDYAKNYYYLPAEIKAETHRRDSLDRLYQTWIAHLDQEVKELQNR